MKKNYSQSNKILGLRKLKHLGFGVPDFDFIPDYTELGLKDCDIDLNYFPYELEKIVKRKLKSFDLKNGISVRSASFDEDKGDKSSAGRYISFNGLTGKEEIMKAATSIWIHHRQNSKNVICPLIIQETHPSFYSGVTFKDGDILITESYYGACSNVVNGSIKPYATIIKKSDTEHNYSENSNYSYLYCVHKNIFKNGNKLPGEKLVPKADFYTFNNRMHSSLNGKMIYVYGNRPKRPIYNYEEKILPQLKEIVKKLDNPEGVDIEWGSDIKGNIYVYQFRPLTRRLQELTRPKNVETFDKAEILGIPASKGIVEGITTNDINSLNESSILVIKDDNIDDINVLSKVKGIISYNGGILSHLSIICREEGIPCIVGLEKQVPIGVKILLNGDIGTIKILK